MHNVQRGVIATLMVSMLVTGLGSCAAPSQETTETMVWTGVVGAGVGALLSENAWRGAVLGAGLGALAGYGLAEIRQRAAQQAAARRNVVTYRNERTNEWVEARPLSYRPHETVVETTVYRGGRVIDRQRTVIPD